MNYQNDNLSLIRANTNTSAFDSGIINENTIDAYANLFYPYLMDNGGNNQNISLTIDILNKEELQEETEDIVNKNWANKNRLQNTLNISKTIWGFKEAYHGVKKSRALSNAIVFSGQQLTFYIAPQGHPTGNIDNEWVYCKTTIVINAIDVVNGTQTVLHTFNGFETSATDTSRYFNWTVPSLNSELFTQYGMFGLNVIRIDVSNEYFKDANWETPLDKLEASTNQVHLQLLIYSGSKEIIEVNAGNLNILTSTPSYSDSLEQIFSNTIFENLQSLNQNSLTAAQKRAIIADQIAVLFISQHPVITADFYPGKVIGSGVNEAVVPKKIIEKAIIYSRRFRNIVPMVNDRLFGMVATYKAFNFVTDIEKYISDFTQSSQIIRDPVRTIYMDSDGVLSDDLGTDGIVFNPYAVNVVNSETIIDSPDSDAIDLILQDGAIDIQNITINPQVINIKTSIVSFSVVYGSEYIKQIRYSILTKEGKNYQTYIDTTGLTRTHLFTLENETAYGDVITAQIDIEDFNGGISSFIKIITLYSSIIGPCLCDLKIYQRNDGSQEVDLYYTYNGIGEIDTSYLSVNFSSDNGSTWASIPTTSLKGDFGSNVMPGRRRVTWKPAIDMPNDIPVLCKLTLDDADGNEAIGNTVTGILVKDLTKPEIDIMRV